ncbi:MULTISPECIES: glycosyltransferase N-terminal domain-containing protein [unclassified Mucilaginibacter]|uniref:3-deoxy-D-manno-octulosonic acid transferase n=1 Tax=unclassified Mucilaginibacter TaxID=2617802 RepID=UPI002AC95032|nr:MULTISPECIES: glycosyltransferase N-terminal domain-containing protein [unclassified Mucilaginibacter]MEB0261060.1 glycosyltransferase N-terminal domain-containing protein [Mucilaginibacter sp. 10I4]MEB0278733.1 glycosyltransferase N-terminal domain-containing protein [Mucilaginibacter sp. 10B2]MEB0301733.1 glycosyltransferase N-terminal domain-containing protein [Mucilaginibacter sp. 5C4]WPX23315.1 glycosyltransferase N-terminal domain-containing protein [Mucilaginibacter sp. 5C4]
MLVLYNIGITLYYTLVYMVSLYKNKAKLWIKGRKKQQVQQLKSSIWFHFASLGEFEQGRPVLEALKADYPQHKIVITFFSPSGYEARKNTPLAYAVYYLPLDRAANARKFIGTIKPVMAIFTKYEYWYHFFNELHKQHVPLYIISGIFRPGQVFFKWYGGLHRKMLKLVTWFFVQDIPSKHLLHDAGITNVTISSDTRFDRVWANAQQTKELPQVAAFKNRQKLFIAGSTWPADEKLIAELITQHPGWKFIIAPHEIGEDKINGLMSLLPNESTIRFSNISNLTSQISCLIIDNIGMLSSLYQYADIAYIGGGFGAGIHNTLEAAAFGMPVIFGPKYDKFKEAKDLVELKAGFSINSQDELNTVAGLLMNDEAARHTSAVIAKNYVEQNIGATDEIRKYIKERH